MIVTRLVGFILRASQLISAVIVAGIVGHYLAIQDNNGSRAGKRFIYTEVVAGLSIIAALILLIPFSWALTVFPFDLAVFLLWIVSFGLLVDYLAPKHCTWNVGWNPAYPGHNASVEDQCSTWKTALAFIFLSAMFWLATALLAVLLVHRNRTSRDPTVRRRRWYRSHY